MIVEAIVTHSLENLKTYKIKTWKLDSFKKVSWEKGQFLLNSKTLFSKKYIEFL